MGRAARRVEISQEQDQQLQELELNPHLHPKVRLRASILRLHGKGMTVLQLAEHFNRNHQAIHNDLTRFEQRGLAGLADTPPPGQHTKFTPEIQQFLHEKLREERFWNAPMLCEAVQQKFGTLITSRAMTNQLRTLGYSWKRARYSPAKTVDSEVIQEHKASIETLKRGRWTVNSP